MLTSRLGNYSLLLVGALLAGCASSQGERALQQAETVFEQVKDDPEVLHSALRDVERAGESLSRARSLAGYWGSADDVEHYAYLGQRYSQIAREHAELVDHQQRQTRLERERNHLQLALREAKLLSAQQQGQWMEEQLVSLAASETDRGLVITLGDMLFDSGSIELKASASRTILHLMQFLQINPQRRIRIEGYTDNSGVAAD